MGKSPYKMVVVFFGFTISLIIIFMTATWVFSAPPASRYNLGETLAPTCSPGSTNCGVIFPAASGANSDIISLSGLTTPLSVLQGGTGTSTAFTVGSIPFSTTGGVYSQNNSKIFWDNTNNRLGINTNVPGSTLDVSGTVAANHIKGTGGTPSISVGSGAGGGATISVIGTDSAGQILLNTGTLPSVSSVVLILTFSNAYGASPTVIFSPANSVAALLSGTSMINVSRSSTDFSFNSGTLGLTASVQYVWNYIVIE